MICAAEREILLRQEKEKDEKGKKRTRSHGKTASIKKQITRLRSPQELKCLAPGGGIFAGHESPVKRRVGPSEFTGSIAKVLRNVCAPRM